MRKILRNTYPWLIAALLLSACGGVSSEDAGGGDAGGEICSQDSACDDGQFCNGVERCAPGETGADARGCVVAGMPPCLDGETCDEGADACVPAGGCADADGDGHPALECGGDDCDDADPTAYPGNIETCDAVGHDEDCDPSTLGSDGDDDGFAGARCCNAQPDGGLLCGEDCDDGNPAVRPGVTDNCNLADDDCDGSVDEDPATMFYRDLDGDGFGRPDDPDAPADERAVLACGGGPGFSAFDTDCDDARPAINPAAAEICADGVDNNCDGVQDADPSDATLVCACTTRGEIRACGGGEVNGAPAVCREGTQTCQVGGFWSGCAGDVPPSGDEVCNGLDDDCNGGVDEGVQVLCFPDADGDGFAAADEVARSVCPVAGREAVGGCPVLFTDRAATDASSIDCAPDERAVSPGAFDGCNGRDDDCDGAVDEGAMDAGCSDEGTFATCALGRCVLLSCAPGRGDCDGAAANGCESDLATSVASCGGCRSPCPESATCVEGLCVGGSGPYAIAQVAGARGRLARFQDGLVSRGVAGAGHTRLYFLFEGPFTDAVDVSLFLGFRGCAVVTSGAVYCWDDRLYDPELVDGVSDAVEVAAGPDYACSLSRGGRVSCWGRCNEAQCGVPPTADPGPHTVPGVDDGVEIEVNGMGGCVRRASGRVTCWGPDADALGGGVLEPGVIRADLLGVDDAIDLSLGDAHGCVVLASGRVRCWGGGDGVDGGATAFAPAPIEISGVTDVVAVTAGGVSTCALNRSGTVICWGSSSVTGYVLSDAIHGPVPIAQAFGVTGISSDGSGYCGLREGALVCWGAVADTSACGDGLCTANETNSGCRWDCPF